MKRICKTYAPMYLGILGGIMGIPSALLSGSLSLTNPVVSESNLYMYCSLLGAIIGLAASLFSKRFPFTSGTTLIISAFLTGITLFIGNALALWVCLLFLSAGFLCFMFYTYVS